MNNAMNVIGMIGNAAKVNLEQSVWLSLRIPPENVRIMLQVINREDENYKLYSKYFLRYYVKYLDEPISHLPAKTVGDIMQARLYDWLHNSLTPPQVFSDLGLTGLWDSARGQPNYKYFQQFLRTSPSF
ncbi:unnamed protein product [Phytophthora lilii]|uniref:Unnamed protein product n=1 Tax=Phytophthora lilii TaxID=2077276 RepID=A0A9W7CQ02_9STRA|nr:unnamed protein product [Phytophthora lilii]